MKVAFDKTVAKIGDEINCAVEIKRKSYSHDGMLLAEIGLPPGVEVDRNSLEKALNEKRAISNYDILPDKIIVYLWADILPSDFSFKFKPRYGINAQTAPSVVYDYYNEEAKTTLAPVRFTAK